VRKISPSLEFDSRTVQLVASRFTDCAIRAYHTPGRTPLNESSARRRGRYPHNTQHKTRKKHALSGIQTHDLRSQVAADLRLRTTRPPGLAQLHIILPCKPAPTYPTINVTPSGFVTLRTHVIAPIRSVCSAHPRFNNHNIQNMKPLIQFSPASCYVFSLGISYSVNPPPKATADNLSEFWGFRGGIADESILFGYDAATMNWIPTFRRDVVTLSSRVANYTTFPRNVGIRLPTDAMSHSRRESPGNATLCYSAEKRPRHVWLTIRSSMKRGWIRAGMRSSHSPKILRCKQGSHYHTLWSYSSHPSLQVLCLASRYCPYLQTLCFRSLPQNHSTTMREKLHKYPTSSATIQYLLTQICPCTRNEAMWKVGEEWRCSPTHS